MGKHPKIESKYTPTSWVNEGSSVGDKMKENLLYFMLLKVLIGVIKYMYAIDLCLIPLNIPLLFSYGYRF